jgi:hypothetical protein
VSHRQHYQAQNRDPQDAEESATDVARFHEGIQQQASELTCEQER